MEHEDIILKPLYGNGGAGVFRIRGTDQNFSSLLELFGLTYPHQPYMAQKYLPDVQEGRQAHHPGGRKIRRRHQPGARRP